MSRDHTPRRIVSLQPSATVILACLDRLDRVVACTKYCADVCPEAARGRTIVADSWTASSTQILAAHPDLVIAAVPYQEKAVSEILKAGARFLGLAPRTLADIYSDIATIAGTVNASERGQEVIRDMQQRIESVRQQTQGLARLKVFCEEWGKPLIRDRGWGEMAAVVERRVYCIRDELLNTPAPTLIQGLHALAAAIHPEHFPNQRALRQISEPRATVREHGRRV
jgi:iron complex transport system substrate-binding protein